MLKIYEKWPLLKMYKKMLENVRKMLKKLQIGQKLFLLFYAWKVPRYFLNGFKNLFWFLHTIRKLALKSPQYWTA